MRLHGSLLFAIVGCAEVAQPFELDHPRVMAVRVDPPAVAAGGTARVEVLITDQGGPRVAPFAEVAVAVPFGATVGRDDRGWFVTAGQTAGLVALDITVQLSGQTATVQKTFAIGTPTANPVVPEIVGELDAIPASRDLVLAPSTRDDLLSYRWFSSVGDLKGFTRAEATLDPIAGATGNIVLVVRDQAGGTAWVIEPATVAP